MRTEASVEVEAVKLTPLTSYNEFIRRFYPDQRKAQEMRGDKPEEQQNTESCLSLTKNWGTSGGWFVPKSR